MRSQWMGSLSWKPEGYCEKLITEIDRISTALNKSLRRLNLCIELLSFQIHLQYHHWHVLFPANLADICHPMGTAATWRAMPLVWKILLQSSITANLAVMDTAQIISISTSKLGPRPGSTSYRVPWLMDIGSPPHDPWGGDPIQTT